MRAINIVKYSQVAENLPAPRQNLIATISSVSTIRRQKYGDRIPIAAKLAAPLPH
jgi:hypothetical protein